MKTLLEKHTPQRWAQYNKVLAGGIEVAIGSAPRQAVYTRDNLTLYKYTRSTPATHATPMLLIYSLVNRPSVLDLIPGRSVIENFLAEGYDVYLLDWGKPDPLDQHLDLNDYVNGLLRTVVRQACKHAGTEQVHLLGYCMGGTLSAIYTALHPERVKTLTLLGTPLNFRSEQLLYQWGCHPDRFDTKKVVEAWAMAPAWSFDGYTLLTAESKPAKMLHLYENLEDEEFMKSYLAMEQWVGDNVPMAGALYEEFCRTHFVENQLYEGKLEIGGRTVQLSSIRCPVLFIAGSKDHLVPPETTCALDSPFANSHSILFPAGHIGLTVSRAAHLKLWPQVMSWLDNY